MILSAAVATLQTVLVCVCNSFSVNPLSGNSRYARSGIATILRPSNVAPFFHTGLAITQEVSGKDSLALSARLSNLGLGTLRRSFKSKFLKARSLMHITLKANRSIKSRRVLGFSKIFRNTCFRIFFEPTDSPTLSKRFSK